MYYLVIWKFIYFKIDFLFSFFEEYKYTQFVKYNHIQELIDTVIQETVSSAPAVNLNRVVQIFLCANVCMQISSPSYVQWKNGVVQSDLSQNRVVQCTTRTTLDGGAVYLIAVTVTVDQLK